MVREFSERCNDFFIVSEDLTQLVLRFDRDATELAHRVKRVINGFAGMIRQMIPVAHENDRKVDFCRQRPKSYHDFAVLLGHARMFDFVESGQRD